jgi:hypothetical protein
MNILMALFAFMAYEDIPEISGNSVVIGTGFDRNNYVYCDKCRA